MDYKDFIFPSVIIPNTSLTANLVFFLRFKDAETYPFHKKEMEVHEWLA